MCRRKWSERSTRSRGKPPQRALWWALSRPGVVFLGLLGLLFASTHAPLWLAVSCWIIGGARVASLLSTPGVDEGVRLKHEKHERGLGYITLSDGEREELLQLDRYRNELISAGGDPTLADGILDEAWQLVRDRSGGRGSARRALRDYRASLPPLDFEEKRSASGMREKLEREIQILRATHREISVDFESSAPRPD